MFRPHCKLCMCMWVCSTFWQWCIETGSLKVCAHVNILCDMTQSWSQNCATRTLMTPVRMRFTVAQEDTVEEGPCRYVAHWSSRRERVSDFNFLITLINPDPRWEREWWEQADKPRSSVMELCKREMAKRLDRTHFICLLYRRHVLKRTREILSCSSLVCAIPFVYR